MAGVPQDGVGRRLEDAVQGEGQLDGAEVGAEVAAGLGDGGDDEVADLAAQLGQVGLGQLAQVVGVTNPFEDHDRDATPLSRRPRTGPRRRRTHLRVGAAMSRLFDLTGHVGLVTGGNSGIGLGYAEGLAECGAAVAIWGTNPAKNDAAVEQLAQLGGDVHAVVCDVGDQDAVVAAMAETVGELGRVDSCFVNAGVGGRAAELPRHDRRGVAAGAAGQPRRRLLHVAGGGQAHGRALGGAATRRRLARVHELGLGVLRPAARPALRRVEGGDASPCRRAIAVEYARYGVRSNAIVPGWIDTEMATGALHWDKFIERNMPRTPARRWGEGDDFAGIAAYLASPAEQLPHRRHHHDRRRLLHLDARSGQDPLRHVLSGRVPQSVVRAPSACLRLRRTALSLSLHEPCSVAARALARSDGDRRDRGRRWCRSGWWRARGIAERGEVLAVEAAAGSSGAGPTRRACRRRSRAARRRRRSSSGWP